MGQGSEYDVGLQVVENLVVSEVGELGEIEDWLFFLLLIILVVVDLNESLSDEVHLLHVTFVTNDSLSWRINPAIHRNNELISKPSLALFEKVVE